MSARILDLPDPDAAAAFARRLATQLGAGDAVLLSGELGAGKTTLARAAIEALTGETDIPSPTYTLIQSYETRSGIPLAHADLYRVEAPDELDELGLEESWREGIALIEWPDRLVEYPGRRIEIELEFTPGGRRAVLRGFGGWETRLVDI